MSGSPRDRDSENERLAQQALAHGFVTQAQLREALAEQAREVAGGRQRPRQLGNILLSKGYLSNDQLVVIRDELRPAPAGPAPTSGVPGGETPGKSGTPDFPPFGKYRLVRELGRGGMGIVYEALDTTLARRVAIKMMLTNPNADPKEAKMDEERFLREARLCANLPKHPNIVSVHEVGVIEGKRYLAMEFVEGVPMHQWKKTGSVSIRQQVALVRDALLALHHAHEHGLIHRDVKPHNILVDGQNQPHVVDFGLAKTVGQDVSVSLTASGMVVGTPIYMSPEQAQGLKTVDRRTDVYAVGAMLYELLTGRPPFTGETAIEILMKAAKNPVPRPSNLVKTKNHPAQDPAIEYVCLRALEKIPRDRYATAKDFAEDLSKWLKGEDVRVVVPVRTRRALTTSKKRNPWVYGGAVAAALLALAAIFGLGSGDSSKRKPVEGRGDGKAGPLVDAKKPVPDVNLLELIDVSRDRIQGRWIADSKGLVDEDEPEDPARPQALPHALRLRIPYEPPEEYDLKIVATRLGHPESLNVCLIVGGRQAVVAMDGGGGTSSVLMGLNDKTEIALVGRFLETNKPATIQMVVRRNRVTVTVDGRYIVDWRGDPKVLGQHSFWTVPEGKTLFIGSFATSYRFHEITLTPVSGPGKRSVPSSPLSNLDLGGGVSVALAYVSPGGFKMGGTEAPGAEWQIDERPQHQVTLTRGYYLGKYEVTRGQFAAFTKATGYRTEAEKEGKAWGWTAGGQWQEIAGNNWMTPVGLKQADDHPVTCISWNDAQAFCDWAAKKAGRAVRLPTEAEWEYACRAGTATKWSFGDGESALGDYAWYGGNSGWSTHPVGQKRPNAWGLYDMYGNVWEWCQDWSGPYGGDAADPKGPANGDRRDLRGGDWATNGTSLSSACRSHSPASHRSAYNGFRVAVSAGNDAPVAVTSRSGRAPADASVILDDFEQGIEGWTFNDGSEFPGAKGSLFHDRAVGHGRKGSLRLSGDFLRGGAYVSGGRNLPQGSDFKQVRFWLRGEGVVELGVRIEDSTGQSLQKPFPLAATREWREVTVTFDQLAGGEHWRGANDGKLHGPVRSLTICISTASFGGAKSGEIWIDDVEGIPAVSPSDARK